jgi:3-oxoacyl-[acyl-carrier-protein] synthase II
VVWRRLIEGGSGIAPIEAFDASRCRNVAGGEIKDPLPTDGGARMAALFEAALTAALGDAALPAAELNRARAALVVGSSFGDIFHADGEPVELDHYIRPSLDRLGIDVPFLSVSSACSSGSDAVAMGADLIDALGYDVVVCGGVDILDIYKMVGHSSLGTLSSHRCVPFSADGDGTLLGEGACFLVLERPEHAARRAVRVRAALTGAASTTDTNTVTSPDLTGAGAARAVRSALAQGDRSAADVAYVNAHGSGTPVNDAMEAKVYGELFAATRPPLSSTKAAFGHTLGATGAIEAAIAIIALEQRQAPPTAGLAAVHEDWQHANLVRPGESTPLGDGRLALSVTYGFGGANVALAFERAGD